MNIHQLSKQIPLSVFTHTLLEDILSPHVNNVNAKISYMVKKGELIRLKKGVYTFPRTHVVRGYELWSAINYPNL